MVRGIARAHHIKVDYFVMPRALQISAVPGK